MLTGELRSKIDAVWNAFWAGGIANPLEVIEQITYLLFMRGLDEAHTREENKANRLGKPIGRRIFPKGKDGIGKDGGIAYEDMRWSRLKNRDPGTMFSIVSEHVFPFLRNMADADTAHATHMKGARFTIPTPALLAKGSISWPISRWRIATPRATCTNTCCRKSRPPGRTASSARPATSSH